MPPASVGFQEQAGVGVARVRDAFDGTAAWELDLADGFWQPGSSEGRQKAGLQLASWRDIPGTALLQDSAEQRHTRLAPSGYVRQAGTHPCDRGPPINDQLV